MADIKTITLNWNEVKVTAEQEALKKEQQRLPIGMHIVKLVKVNQWDNETTKQSTLILTFKTEEGTHQNKVGYARIMLYKIEEDQVQKNKFHALVGEYNPQSLLKIAEFMAATGFAMPAGTFTFNAENFIGKVLRVVIAAGKAYKNREGVMATPLNVVRFKPLHEPKAPLHDMQFNEQHSQDSLLNPPPTPRRSVPWETNTKETGVNPGTINTVKPNNDITIQDIPAPAPQANVKTPPAIDTETLFTPKK